jgi:hypothetical protein
MTFVDAISPLSSIVNDSRIRIAVKSTRIYQHLITFLDKQISVYLLTFFVNTIYIF